MPSSDAFKSTGLFSYSGQPENLNLGVNCPDPLQFDDLIFHVMMSNVNGGPQTVISTLDGKGQQALQWDLPQGAIIIEDDVELDHIQQFNGDTNTSDVRITLRGHRRSLLYGFTAEENPEVPTANELSG